jgi:hypothetical protein
MKELSSLVKRESLEFSVGQLIPCRSLSLDYTIMKAQENALENTDIQVICTEAPWNVLQGSLTL